MIAIPLPTTKSTIKIGGTAVAMPDIAIPRRLIAHVRRGVPSFAFEVRGGKLPTGADPYLGKSVELNLNGTVRFVGQVQSRPVTFRDGFGWVRSYQAVAQDDRASYFPHSDQIDGTDTSVYNAPSDNNRTEYLLARAGRTVGQILTDVLTMDANATALNAAGLMAYASTGPAVLPAATIADLAALTIIPQGPIRFGGEKFYGALESFCSIHAPHHTVYFEPTGKLRLLDLRSYTPRTFTFGTDPIRLTGVSFDISECYSRVVVRGEPIAKMCNLTLSAGGLNETPFAHDGLTVAQAKTLFNPDDWQRPGYPSGQAQGTATITGGVVTSILVTNQGNSYSSAPSVVITGGGGSGATATTTLTSGRVTSFTVTAGGSGYTSSPTVVVAAKQGASSDAGTCTCPSTTTVTVTSADKGMVYAANLWDQAHKQGTMFLWYSAGSGLTQFDQSPIVANTALAAGGTATFTLANPLAVTNYDTYLVTGLAKSSAAVWSLYGVTDSTIGSKMVEQSTYPFAYHLSDAPSATLTSTPIGAVLWSQSGLPPYIEIVGPVAVDPINRTIRFPVPSFITAGNHVPSDVRAFVPVVTGQNQVAAPADIAGVPQYSGTSDAYITGRSKTLTVQLRGWRDPGQTAAVQAYAAEILDSVKDVHCEATLTWHGFLEDALTPGMSANIAGGGYTTAWEALALPVVETQVEWDQDGIPMVTTMQLSNRRAHLSAEAFLHPDRTGLSIDFGGATFNPLDPATRAYSAEWTANSLAQQPKPTSNIAGLADRSGPQWTGGNVGTAQNAQDAKALQANNNMATSGRPIGTAQNAQDAAAVQNFMANAPKTDAGIDGNQWKGGIVAPETVGNGLKSGDVVRSGKGRRDAPDKPSGEPIQVDGGDS